MIDLAVALPMAVVATPVAVAVAVTVRLALGSPVVFRQERAGRAARPIVVPKFRTMSDARDTDGSLLPDEQRLGRVGRALRSLSLDELPQLWSIVKGDMSIVGPRPLPIAYVDRYDSEQRRRLEARPGLTGWAQVNGRNQADWPERLAMDVWYVDHASLALDLRILGRTVDTVLRRRGVSAAGHVTMNEFRGGSD